MDAAPPASSICERAATQKSQNSATAPSTRKAEENNLRRKDEIRQLCTTARRPPRDTITPTKVTTAPAEPDSGSSFSLCPSAPSLHLPRCKRSRSWVCAGSSPQASVGDMTKFQWTVAPSGDSTACDNSSGRLSARELHVVSPLKESSLCCCCDCCSSSIVITSTAELSTHRKLSPLYPVPPSPRKFYDRQGSGMSGKPGWYGHNYPSFRSTRIQQCGLLYLKWRRSQLRIGTLLLLLLQEIVQHFLYTLRRGISPIFLTLQDAVHSSVQEEQSTSRYSMQQQTMSDASIRAKTGLLDLPVETDAERQQTFPHVCALPYCNGAVPLQCGSVSHCDGNLHRENSDTRLPPARCNSGCPLLPEELEREFCQVGQREAAVVEAWRSNRGTRLSFVPKTFQAPPSDGTGGMPKGARGIMEEEESLLRVHSHKLLDGAAHETSHVGAHEGQNKVSVRVCAFQRKNWLILQGAAESRSRNQRRRVYPHRAIRKLPQEAEAIAVTMPKKSPAPDRISYTVEGVRRGVEDKKEKNVYRDGVTAAGNQWREKFMAQREGNATAVSGFKMRAHTGKTFVSILLKLFVPSRLHSHVNSKLVLLSTRLALLTRIGLLRGCATFLLHPLRQLLLEAPKHLLLPFMPTVVANILKVMARERENLGVPDSEIRRRLNFLILLMIMYPFVHGFYIPCLLLMWPFRRVHDAFWRLCATGFCNYSTSTQQLRRWQDGVHQRQQQQHQLPREQNLQPQKLCRQRDHCKLQYQEDEAVSHLHERHIMPQKLESQTRRRLQRELAKPSVPAAHQDGGEDRTDQRGQQYPEKQLEHKKQQKRWSLQEEGKRWDRASWGLQQYSPRARGCQAIWNQVALCLQFLTQILRKPLNHARHQPASEAPTHSKQGVAAARGKMARLYSGLHEEVLQRMSLYWFAILPVWNAFCFLILLPSRQALTLLKSVTARPFSAVPWALSIATAVEAQFFRLLRRVSIVATASTRCISRRDECSKDESMESRTATLLQKRFFSGSFRQSVFSFSPLETLRTKSKAFSCYMLRRIPRDTLEWRTSRLLRAAYSAVSGFRQGNRSLHKQRETEILSLLNGQELVLFSQPHMVVCGVGYTEKLTREELLHVIRKKLLAQRDDRATQQAQHGSEEGDNIGIRYQQSASERQARKQGNPWQADRIYGGENEEDVMKKPADECNEQSGDTPSEKKVNEEQGTWKQRGRGGNEKHTGEENITENSSDEDCAIPLLCFKHPRLRTTVRKVLNRYCWMRDKNFSPARHVISLNRQQVLTLLALHKDQDSPTDFSRFKQNLAVEQAGPKGTHSISRCQSHNRENVLRGKKGEDCWKAALPCRVGVTWPKVREGAAEHTGRRRLSEKEEREEKEEEVMSNSGEVIRKAARDKQQFERREKSEHRSAGKEPAYSSDPVNWSKLVLGTCSFRSCERQESLFVRREIPLNDGGNSMRISEQSGEVQACAQEKVAFTRSNRGETSEENNIQSSTGRPHRCSNRKDGGEGNTGNVFVRVGSNCRIRDEDGLAFSPVQTLPSHRRSKRNTIYCGESEENGKFNNLFGRRYNNDEGEEGLYNRNGRVSQAHSEYFAEEETGSAKGEMCCCIVRKEEAQAFLTLLASQTLPPGQPLWQFVLLESVELPPTDSAATDVSALEKAGKNILIQRNSNRRLSTDASCIEGAAVETRHRRPESLLSLCTNKKSREMCYRGQGKISSGDRTARLVQIDRTAIAAKDRVTERKRNSRIRIGQIVRSTTMREMNNLRRTSLLTKTCASSRNPTEIGRFPVQKRRFLGMLGEVRGSRGSQRTASAVEDAGRSREAITTATSNSSTETAENGEEAICCVQSGTDESRRKIITQEAENASGRETFKRRISQCGGDCDSGDWGGGGGANKGYSHKLSEPRIGSMIIFRVHHSVADGIALTNMILSDVFSASPPKQQRPSSLLEHHSSSTATPATHRDVISAARGVSVFSFEEEKRVYAPRAWRSEINERSEEVGDPERKSTQKQRECRESGSGAEGQEQKADMRPKVLQSEVPSSTASTTAASSPASAGQRIEGATLCRGCPGLPVQRGQISENVGCDAGATESDGGPASWAPIATSSALSSASAELHRATGVFTPVAASPVEMEFSAGSLRSPPTSSGTKSSRCRVSSSCSASDALMASNSVRCGLVQTCTPEVPSTFPKGSDSLPWSGRSDFSYSQARIRSCSSKYRRCPRRTEAPTTEETVSHGRCCSNSAALANFTLTAPSPIKPMVPPVAPPSLLPRVLLQIVAYLRIPWEVCFLLMLRRDRSWDKVAQPRRPRTGWAHEVHSIRFDLQQLRKLRRCLITTSGGKIGKPLQPPAAFLPRQSAPLSSYSCILCKLRRAISVVCNFLLRSKKQPSATSPDQMRGAAELFVSPFCGDSTQQACPSGFAAVAAAASAASTGAALERLRKHDATESKNFVVATPDSSFATVQWVSAAGGLLLSLARSCAASIRLSIAAAGNAGETAGNLHCACLKRKRCGHISATNKVTRTRPAATLSQTEAAAEPRASSPAVGTKFFTINELLTSCVAGGVTRYIRATTSADRFDGPLAKTSRRSMLRSSCQLEFLYQPSPVSLPLTPGHGGKLKRPQQRCLISTRSHNTTHEIQVSPPCSPIEGRITTAVGFFCGLPGTLVTARPRAVGNSSACRWRRESIASKWDNEGIQTIHCRERCRQLPTDASAVSPERYVTARCARRKSCSRFANFDGENGKTSGAELRFGKWEAYGKEATLNDEKANPQQRCLIAATSTSDNLSRHSVVEDVGSEGSKISGENASPCILYQDVAPQTAGKYSTCSASQAGGGINALAQEDADRKAKLFLPNGNPQGLLVRGNSQIAPRPKVATHNVSCNVPERQQHQHFDRTTIVQASFQDAPLAARLAGLLEESEVSSARAATLKPVPVLTDANVTRKKISSAAADYTHKNRGGQFGRLKRSATEHLVTRKPIRRFTQQTRHLNRLAASAAAIETREIDRENKKRERAEGLQQIRQSLLDLNIVIPVNLRTTEEESFQLHNNFTSVVVQLAVADLLFAETAYQRLIRVQTQLRKSVRSAGASVFGLMEKICFATTPDFTWFLHMWLTNKLSMVLSNVPGPPVLPQIHGRQVYRMNFIGSLAGKVGINASAFSYANSLDLVLHIDRAVLASPELLRKCIVDEYRELEQAGAYCCSSSHTNLTRVKSTRIEDVSRNIKPARRKCVSAILQLLNKLWQLLKV